MKKNERKQAMEILLDLLENKTPLTHLLAATPDLSPFAKDICFGVCRYYFQLQALANSLLQKKIKSLEVWVVLLMGLYQLHYMRQPDYAAVKETVSLLEKSHTRWAKGLVNAVLRNSSRQFEELTRRLAEKPDYQFNHPDWLLKELQTHWPDDWQTIAKANDQHPPMTLRVNALKTSRKDYLEKLKVLNIEAEAHPYADEAIILSKPCEVSSLPGFREGFVSVQDAAAQLAAHLIDAKPGMRVLDACAAPGGKTCHLLETQPALAACVALDIDSKRLEKVKQNLKRLQLSAEIIAGNGLKPEQWWDGQCFDRILLDAPCTATGVIRRHPDIKLLREPEELIAISEIQQALLERLWPLLAAGGKMVYATCSILPQENTKQIQTFVEKHPDCKVEDRPKDWGHFTGVGWQILPGEANMDGFFYSVLKKDEL